MNDIRHYINIIEEAVNVNSEAFRAWFRDSKVVDADGNPLPVFHGTQRPDRVGTIFRRSRATAGPMAYFTDSKEVASNYANSKADTSYEGESNYDTWFFVKIPNFRSKINIVNSWFFLSQQQKEKIIALSPGVHKNDNGDVIYDKENTNGIGGFSDTIKEKKGNYLAALVDRWLDSGALFNDEYEFLKVLKLSGFPYHVEYNNPKTTYPAVYAVYLSIQHPLVTNNIPQKVVEALLKASKRVRSQSTVGFSWNKKEIDPNIWMKELFSSIENDSNTHWTTVPDWVTKTLQSFGYDGIKDSGGKNINYGHTVWIPFMETQVKSAISNTKFDPNKKSIHS